MNFELKKVKADQLRTVIANKASETVIAAGDLVGMTSGLIVKAGATTAELAYAPYGAAAGVTEVEVTLGNDFYLTGPADAVFAVANKGTEVDVVMSGTTQQIDLGTSTTDVLKVGISSTAGVVDSASDIEVKINKPLF